MTPDEERVAATHEAGHAVVALFTPHSQPIERISLLDDVIGATAYVLTQESPHKYVITRAQYLDGICVDMGGREAEQMLLDGLSLGSGHDLMMATNKARALVEAYGMGDEETGVCNYWVERGNGRGSWWERYPQLSETQKASLDRRVKEIIEEQRQRAIRILNENRARGGDPPRSAARKEGDRGEDAEPAFAGGAPESGEEGAGEGDECGSGEGVTRLASSLRQVRVPE